MITNRKKAADHLKDLRARELMAHDARVWAGGQPSVEAGKALALAESHR